MGSEIVERFSMSDRACPAVAWHGRHCARPGVAVLLKRAGLKARHNLKGGGRSYLDGIKVAWLATHCHVWSCLIQVSVKRSRCTYGLPFSMPLMRKMPTTMAASP